MGFAHLAAISKKGSEEIKLPLQSFIVGAPTKIAHSKMDQILCSRKTLLK